MKNTKVLIYMCAMLFLVFACEKEVLDKIPVDKYSDATVWTDINLADSYLQNCFYNSSYGYNVMMQAGASDEAQFLFIKNVDKYLLGTISSGDNILWNTTGGYSFAYAGWNLFNTIQVVNIFLSKIDEVVNAYGESEKESIKAQADLLKGEALFLRAYCYHFLCRAYGGIPLFDKPNELGDDFSSLKRSTFKETVDFIASDCDEAAKLLKLKSEMEMGRPTKEAALALKSRILLFAASDLTADGTSENELVAYSNPNRNALWTAARDAAKAVIDLGTAKLADFGAPDKKAVAQNYYDFFRAKDLSNEEVIWGRMYLTDVGGSNYQNLRNGNNGNEQYGSHSPTQNLVDSYQMEDGSDFFDHFSLDADNYYKNKSNTYKNENPYYNREPRFYGSILYDSAVWQPRYAPDLEAIDPLGIYDRRTHKTIQSDGSVTMRYGLDTRNGPVQNWNGTYTGYIFKKWLDEKVYGYYEKNENAWILMRYAEVLLNYAEACIELGDNTTASIYINMIRNRAGLPNFQGDITEALCYERKIELVYEDSRWYDIRRWKILEQTLVDAKGMEITEVSEAGNITTTWKQIFVESRGPVTQKMYWVPIPKDEINKSPEITQNPGYE